MAVPMAVSKLLASGQGGRLELDVAPWKLDHCHPVSPGEWESDDDYTDNESVASKDSSITSVIDSLVINDPANSPTNGLVMPGSPTLNTTTRVMPGSPAVAVDFALQDTPTDGQHKKRKAPDDCHALIQWLELQNLVKAHMACAKCDKAITLATELDFQCTSCKSYATAHALRSDYVLEQSEKEDFICRESRMDSYELKWRFILATQLIGESQVCGSIIGLMLDLARDAFQNVWLLMEEALGMEHIKIGGRFADFNLKKDAMGTKVAIFCDGTAKYPMPVSYDMGWQKAAKTYDSLSGQGLMIGDQTNHVVAYQNYSKSCSVCHWHAKRIEVVNQKLQRRMTKGQLPRNHPPNNFLADLCHRDLTFGKYLWDLKQGRKKKSCTV
jgi:hypothetical protein